jgi:hypothetical protein
MASRQQLVKLILQNLGVWQAGQDLPAEDYQAVNERLPYDLLAMKSADVYDHTDANIIPDEALINMAAYLSQNYITTFGLGGEEKADVIAQAEGAEQALRYMRVMDHVNDPIQIQSF